MKKIIAISAMALSALLLSVTLLAADKYENFITSVYARVYEVRQMEYSRLKSSPNSRGRD